MTEMMKSVYFIQQMQTIGPNIYANEIIEDTLIHTGTECRLDCKIRACYIVIDITLICPVCTHTTKLHCRLGEQCQWNMMAPDIV